MQDLRYARASNVADAVRLLADGGPTARILAGGTDVIVQARERTREISLFVDVKHVPEVMALRSANGAGLSIGAATPCYRIYGDSDVQRDYPALVDAASLIGGTAIQGRASLGGNLCNASPAADCVPAMVAASAVCTIAGPTGRRDLAVGDVATGPGQTALGKGEFVVDFRLPERLPRSGDAYLRFIPRTEMDIAVVGAGVNVALDDDGVCTAARVVLGAVAPRILLVPEAAAALVGARLDDDALGRLDAACRAACRPIDDKRGTIVYRTKVSGVLARRAAAIAFERARTN